MVLFSSFTSNITKAKEKELLHFEKFEKFFHDPVGHIWLAKYKTIFNTRNLTDEEYERLQLRILKFCPTAEFKVFGNKMRYIALPDEGDNAMFIFYANCGLFA